MHHFLRIAAAFALVFAAPVVAQESDDAPIAPENEAALQQAMALGQTIYLYDQAAWHTTDAMLASVADPGGEGIRGWIINEVEGGHEAVFYRPTSDGYEAVWAGVYDGSQVVQTRSYASGERPLAEAEAAMAQAASLMPFEGTGYSLCSQRLNRVVMPSGKSDGGLYVYFLAPQPELNQFPFGGHFRFEVVDGEVVDHRKFANSCLTMTLESEDGQTPAVFAVSHLLDATPTEIHVFSMLAAKLPVAVITTSNERLWMIEQEDGQPKIRVIEQ